MFLTVFHMFSSAPSSKGRNKVGKLIDKGELRVDYRVIKNAAQV